MFNFGCNLAKVYVKQARGILDRRAVTTELDKRNAIDSNCDLEDSDIARRLSCRKKKIKEKIKCNEIEFKNKFVSFTDCWGKFDPGKIFPS